MLIYSSFEDGRTIFGIPHYNYYFNTCSILKVSPCTDDVDGSITPTSSGTVDASQAGTYTVTYSCTDLANNEATPVSRTVIVSESMGQSPPPLNHPPTVDAGSDRTVNEMTTVTLSGSASNPDVGDILTYSWSQDSGTPVVTLTNDDTLRPQFTAPGVASDVEEVEFVFRLAVTDDLDKSAEDTVTITVRNVPITVSSATYNPGNGQLTITFNYDIGTVDYSGLHVRSADSDTGGITLFDADSRDISSARTITAVLDSDMRETYADLTDPHLVTDNGAVTDTDGDTTTDVPDLPIRDVSSRKKSSSLPPAVDLGTLAYQRHVDIPPHIAEQMTSRSDSDPLEPLVPDGTFEFPLVINGYGYLLDASINTLVPQTVTAGDDGSVTITFTVYTEKDLAHFALYLNLQDGNTDYVDSDTYIMYKDGDGTTVVTDPHGYIADATITVTQEDDSVPERKTVRITIEFGDEPMGSTNMVAYMWNTDRKATFVRMIDALEVVMALPLLPPQEPVMQAADPEPVEPDSVLPTDPEPAFYDILEPDDYDEVQVLHLIRMWSGFEPEMITDEQLLASLGFDDDDYPDADIPDWVMTKLGVLVVKGDVTVNELVLVLQYVLDGT